MVQFYELFRVANFFSELLVGNLAEYSGHDGTKE